MSLVLVNIRIDFTAEYAGQHRACYRLMGSSGPYTCINTTSCVAVGDCVALIPVYVDNETCEEVQYEGYLQPTCQDSASLSGRVVWTYTFTPTPTCQNYQVSCDNSGVGSAVITSPGSSYNPSSPPSILFTGGSGTGAAGTAVVGFGAITAIAISVHGTGYVNGTYTNVTLTGGSGTGAKATVIIVGGIVTTITITTVGTGYLSTDVLGVTTAQVGGAVTIPSTYTIISDYGKVNSITITSQGSGYTTAPIITIAPSGAGAATATAVLSACPDFTDNGCSGTPVVIPQGSLSIGDTMSVCSLSGPPVVSNNYSVVLSGNCLCSCNLATIGVSGPVGTSVKYFYNSCGGAVVTGVLTVGGSPSSIVVCAVSGSIVFQILTVGTIGTISLGGAC